MSKRRTKNITGQRIKQARKRKRPALTQAELAAKVEVAGVHVERAAIAKIETGRRLVTDFELKAIANALGVSVTWLLGD
jgi:transcriptional regulator with XRE-family HTH domain